MNSLTSAVAAIITDSSGRVLLCQQNQGHRVWGLPGGKIRDAESPMHAVTRDVREETGLEIQVADLVGIYHLTGDGCGEGLPDVLVHVFRAQIVSGEALVNSPSWIRRLTWADPSALPEPLTATTLLAGAGHPPHAGGVDEAAGGRDRAGQPLVGGAGRHQEHPVQLMLVGGGEPRLGLVGDQVRGDQPGTARRGEVPGEAVHAVLLDRVPVGHQQGRHAGGGDRLDRTEHVAGTQPGSQRDVAGPLDHRPVHHRVRVREPDLDHVDPGVHHRADRLDPALHRGKARRQVTDQHAAVLGPRLPEGDAHTHASFSRSSRSNHSAAVSMSLSPRPDRLTTIVASGPSSRATRSAPERAWALSIAGMMPSVRHSRENASIASASVTRWKSRTITGNGCGPPTEPIT